MYSVILSSRKSSGSSFQCKLNWYLIWFARCSRRAAGFLGFYLHHAVGLQEVEKAGRFAVIALGDKSCSAFCVPDPEEFPHLAVCSELPSAPPALVYFLHVGCFLVGWFSTFSNHIIGQASGRVK